MGEVERPQETPDHDGHRSARLTRRGNRMQLSLAKIELAMSGVVAVDRLLVLNQGIDERPARRRGRALIWSANGKRRHMSKGQLAMIAACSLEPKGPGSGYV